MKQTEVIQELKNYVQAHLDFAESLNEKKDSALNHHPSEGAWNALQCLEHLNRYGDFYLVEIGNKVSKGRKQSDDKNFKPGFWGKLFTNMMLPKKGMFKMKTFTDKNPEAIQLNRKTIDTFIQQQLAWLQLLEEAKQVDLNKNNCKLTLPVLKMNLGSTLQFNLYHNERHIVQAKKALESFSK